MNKVYMGEQRRMVVEETDIPKNSQYSVSAEKKNP